MKIKNDLIRIKSNGKTYDFQNMIMNEYLKRFAFFQTSENNINDNLLGLNICLLKFDTPFENLSEESNIYNQDFDIALILLNNYSQELSNKQVVVEYYYKDVQSFYNEQTQEVINDISEYYDRPITAIGFNTLYANSTTRPVCAILDTSNYNIYLSKNQDFVITRRDIITTDADFYCNNKLVKAPAHLAPYGIPQLGFGVLYSIGLSSHKDYINEEYVIGEDITITVDDNKIISSDFINNYTNETPIPNSNNIYPSSNLYPIKTNYKYLIFKYKIWNTLGDTGIYYYQAVPLNTFGELNFLIKYERG